jgi:hypothetical protein
VTPPPYPTQGHAQQSELLGFPRSKHGGVAVRLAPPVGIVGVFNPLDSPRDGRDLHAGLCRNVAVLDFNEENSPRRLIVDDKRNVV